MINFRKLLLAGVAATMLASAGGQAMAQSQEWNALFDRIIRLEHEVRAMQGNGGAGGGDSGYRLTAIEEQLRNLAAQLGTMNQQMQDMQGQIEALKRQQSGRVDQQPAASQLAQQPAASQLAQQPAPASPSADLYTSSNGDLDLTVLPQTSEPLQSEYVPDSQAPGSYGTIQGQQLLGQLTVNNDGSFSASPQPQDNSNSLLPGTVETASLGNVDGGSGAASPDDLYKRSYDNLLKRRFGLAAAGFQTFLSQNGSHPLAGEARYWLGETYYAQGEYKQAAQSFLAGYKGDPKGAKAADSLLKLGMSLGRLGQTKQACGAYAEVQRSYGSSSAGKLAAREAQRGGC